MLMRPLDEDLGVPDRRVSFPYHSPKLAVQVSSSQRTSTVAYDDTVWI